MEEQTVKLTGLPVSDKMKDILERLSRKEDVSIDEIYDTREIKTAQSNIDYSMSTANLKNREDIQNNIANKMLETGSAVIDEDGKVQYNGIVNKNSRLDIVIGLPASGKSSAIVDTLSVEFHSRVIDNDVAKEMIPQFNNGWGAGVVHEESQQISGFVYDTALLRGENIVLPKVGANADKLVSEFIGKAKTNGYQVYVHYVELDRNKALGRMLNRFIETGRFLEPKLIEKYAPMGRDNKIEVAYENLKNGGMIDGYSKWNNDVGRGEKPILIETNCRGKFIDQGRTGKDFKLDNEGMGRSGRNRKQGDDLYSKVLGKSDENEAIRESEVKRNISPCQGDRGLNGNVTGRSNEAGYIKVATSQLKDSKMKRTSLLEKLAEKKKEAKVINAKKEKQQEKEYNKETRQ